MAWALKSSPNSEIARVSESQTILQPTMRQNLDVRRGPGDGLRLMIILAPLSGLGSLVAIANGY